MPTALPAAGTVTAPAAAPAAAPARLDDDEARMWLALRGLALGLPAAVGAHLERTAGLSLVEYQVLAALGAAPDRTLRIRQLVPSTHARLSHLSRVVTRLEGWGWVTRRPDPHDGRSTLATLTAAGRAKAAEAAPEHDAVVRRLLLDQVSAEELRHLTAVAERVRRGVDARL